MDVEVEVVLVPEVGELLPPMAVLDDEVSPLVVLSVVAVDDVVVVEADEVFSEVSEVDIAPELVEVDCVLLDVAVVVEVVCIVVGLGAELTVENAMEGAYCASMITAACAVASPPVDTTPILDFSVHWLVIVGSYSTATQGSDGFADA